MSLNVMIVDDSAVMRSMVFKTLRLSGLPVKEIHQASNGQEALALFEKHWIDLALVDLNMPVMSGEELIDRVKADPARQNLPIIAVSTKGSQTRIDSLRAKGVAFVQKPFTPEKLRQVILELTGVECGEQTNDGTVPCSGPDF
jgi:two-component system chemotaxis response regulator CheY